MTAIKKEVNARQIAFCSAFILPLGKFLETPSLLSLYAKGDILLPAILQFLAQTLLLTGALFVASRSQKSLLERLQEWLGKGMIVLYLLYALFFLFFAILPLLDLEKFVYAAFFDTAPTTFSFGVFFLLLAFVCAKGLKSFARAADLSLFFFVVPFLALLVMAAFDTDLSRLLPFFGTDFSGVSRAFVRSTPHFSDAILLLPLIANLRFQEGDGVKISIGYFVGAVFSLLLFAVFFGVYSTIAPREHYAFSKIAQYFPALDVIGRIDLLFVYLISAVLLFYTCLPVLYAAECLSSALSPRFKIPISAVLSLGLFLFTLFANQHYNALYFLISARLTPLFWVFADILPLFLFLLPNGNANKGKEVNNEEHAQ